jgi:uncharacterized protein (TIGR02246 family)
MLATTPEEAVKELDQAFARRDIDAVLAFYENDAAVVVKPGHIARGKEELRKFFIQLFAHKSEAHQLKTHIIESGDVALFISKWRFAGEGPGGERFSRESVATSVFRKGADGKWRMVIDNSVGPAVLESADV